MSITRPVKNSPSVESTRDSSLDLSSDNKENKLKTLLISTLQNAALYLGLLSLVITVYYFIEIPFLSNIDYFDFFCDFMLAVVLLVTTYFIQGLRGSGQVKNVLLVGFCFFYFAFFMDVLDELFVQAFWVTTVFENLFQLVGLILIAYGVRGWLDYNNKNYEYLQKMSYEDQLTGALNRRKFLSSAEAEFDRTRRYKRDLAIIFIDIDFFKSINDNHGHAAGDKVIRALALNTMTLLRDADSLCRWGGEEFLLLLPETNQEQCLKTAERIRKNTEITVISVASSNSDQTESDINITVSVGCATVNGDDFGIHAVIERADQALYRAKNEGRNRVCYF